MRSSDKLVSQITRWLLNGAHFRREWLPDLRNTLLLHASAYAKIQIRARVKIMMRIRIRPRMRIRIKTQILIMTCGLKAKGPTDIKLQVARLIWPGGMSGAPGLNSNLNLCLPGVNDFLLKTSPF